VKRDRARERGLGLRGREIREKRERVVGCLFLKIIIKPIMAEIWN
jgi:hypothetical protein